MLVLSRKKGESIQIAENINITVCEVRGGRVRLSIDAPRSVRVLRGEIVIDSPELEFSESNCELLQELQQ